MKFFKIFIVFILVISCFKDNGSTNHTPIETALYFPPLNGTEWATSSINQLGWNETNTSSLYEYLETNNTRAFLILKDGKIVIEKYWGNNIIGTEEFNMNSLWYWASAGKSLTATLVGIAQEEGYLDINQKTSDFLGTGWTSMSEDKENLITIKNQLTMTTGLDYQTSNLNCTDPACLTYRKDAGTQWYYHNAPYTLLEKVISNASGTYYNDFTDQKVESKIGMNGQWIQLDFNNVYWSTARDMARFGLMILNKGTWDDTPVLADLNYYQAMINSSQDLNPSYGYLWWLNGKSSIIFPSLVTSINMKLAPNASDDLFAALGKNGQFIEIIPSQNLIVIRMGEAPDDSLVPIAFHDEM